MEPEHTLRSKRPSELVTERSFRDQIGTEKGLYGLQTDDSLKFLLTC